MGFVVAGTVLLSTYHTAREASERAEIYARWHHAAMHAVCLLVVVALALRFVVTWRY
jgi:hypothetical protein